VQHKITYVKISTRFFQKNLTLHKKKTSKNDENLLH